MITAEKKFKLICPRTYVHMYVSKVNQVDKRLKEVCAIDAHSGYNLHNFTLFLLSERFGVIVATTLRPLIYELIRVHRDVL
jgi:hypothetical protein